MSFDARPIPCAGAIVFDATGRLLLIQRGRPPEPGRWSIPGGKSLRGELAAATAVRETREETGLEVQVVRHVGRVLRDGPPGATYEIDDYLCEVVGGALAAADDAVDARWADPAELRRLPLTTGLHEALREWGVLPG